jgi:hypothetical protein
MAAPEHARPELAEQRRQALPGWCPTMLSWITRAGFGRKGRWTRRVARALAAEPQGRGPQRQAPATRRPARLGCARGAAKSPGARPGAEQLFCDPLDNPHIVHAKLLALRSKMTQHDFDTQIRGKMLQNPNQVLYTPIAA